MLEGARRRVPKLDPPIEEPRRAPLEFDPLRLGERRAPPDELVPPTPPLPSGALAEFSKSSPTVLLLPPSPELMRRVDTAARIPQTWPGGREAEVLSERLRRRLPSARVMRIDGWVLAETEARLLALAQLLH